MSCQLFRPFRATHREVIISRRARGAANRQSSRDRTGARRRSALERAARPVFHDRHGSDVALRHLRHQVELHFPPEADDLYEALVCTKSVATARPTGTDHVGHERHPFFKLPPYFLHTRPTKMSCVNQGRFTQRVGLSFYGVSAQYLHLLSAKDTTQLEKDEKRRTILNTFSDKYLNSLCYSYFDMHDPGHRRWILIQSIQ